MTYLQALILGIVQGLTEFIPVSSSAHLTLIPEVLNWTEQPTSFDIFLHAGTLLALIIFFRKKLKKIFKKNDTSTIKNLAISAIPLIFFGGVIVLVNKKFDGIVDEFIKHPFVLVFTLIFIGIIFIFTEFIFSENKDKYKNLNKKDAGIIGLFQSLSLIRGTSRSGITILAGLSRGLTRAEAAEYAFLLGIPVLALSIIYQLFDVSINGFNNISTGAVITGFIASFISGFISIHFLMSFLKNHSLAVFGIYRIIFGLGVLFLLG